MNKFKDGDKVYIPMLSTKVLVVTTNAPWRKEPPTPPSSREIIRAMLERGDKNVLCWVGNTRKEVESGYLWKFITEYNENSDYPYVSEGRGSVGSWVFAIPIDHRTEQPITEMPE